LRILEALKIATVASAIGLPPSSRTIPFIVPKVAALGTGAPGSAGAFAYVSDAAVKIMTSNRPNILAQVKPIDYKNLRTITFRKKLVRGRR
jgi:hypothetical protein